MSALSFIFYVSFVRGQLHEKNILSAALYRFVYNISLFARVSQFLFEYQNKFLTMFFIDRHKFNKYN